MELGGKNSTIVLDDADLDAASDMLVHAALTYGGQVCMCTDRIISTDRIFDDLTERVLAKTSASRVGDPSDVYVQRFSSNMPQGPIAAGDEPL